MRNHSLSPLPLIVVFISLSLLPVNLTTESFSRWILWNVGQGQFLTLSLPEICWHFDVGGENAPWPVILHECQSKRNAVVISHWDWDHMSMLESLQKKLPLSCLALPPLENHYASNRKKTIIKKMFNCPRLHKNWEEIHWQGLKKKNSNEWSRVFYDPFSKILIPGDSTKNQEKLWSQQNHRLLFSSQILVIGHHGSVTSSSPELLRQLPQLKIGLISARKKRYGHPHPKVVEQFKKIGVPLIQTEIWGNIVIPIKPFYFYSERR